MGPEGKKGEVNAGLADALREFGEPTTPAELTARGTNRVRVVSKELVSKLIEKAVNRTVIERTIGVGEGEIARMVELAQVEFDRLLRVQLDLDTSRDALAEQRNAFTTELARVRSDLSARRIEDLRPERGQSELERDEERVLREQMRRAFDRFTGGEDALRELEREVYARSLAALRTSRRVAAELAAADRDLVIQQLERRLAKLVVALQAAESAVRGLNAMRGVDDGLESIYRVVQGLAPGEPELERRQAMMGEIFKKNFELLQQLRMAGSI